MAEMVAHLWSNLITDDVKGRLAWDFPGSDTVQQVPHLSVKARAMLSRIGLVR